MTNPVTVNTGIIVPLTGADVDTWGEDDVNPNMVAIDGLFAGVQTISVSNVSVLLTSPAGFTPTPSPGPTQSQNAVISFTGVQTADVTVTLPLPGRYIVQNMATGNFLLGLRAIGSGQTICLPQGSQHTIFCDGTNVKFVDLGKAGDMELWAGLTALPTWVTSSSVPPYVLCDGTVYNFATFPYLGARLLGNFGGNGTTTFGTPDLRGRVPLAYDGTGTRITVVGCNINGQLLGSAADAASVVLLTTQIPPHVHPNVLNDLGHTHNMVSPTANTFTGGGAFPCGGPIANTVTGSNNTVVMSITNAAAGGGAHHTNVQPAQVCGIWVIKT